MTATRFSIRKDYISMMVEGFDGIERQSDIHSEEAFRNNGAQSGL